MTVTVNGSNYRFTHSNSTTFTAGSGCTTVTTLIKECPLNPATSVVVNLGDQNDTFTAAGVNQDPFTINGASGSDTITGSDANDVIDGGSGDDTLNGGPGNDILYGGSSGADDLNSGDGNDRMDGGQGSSNAESDDYDGGPGIDRVVYGTLTGFTYTCTSQAVVVTMDNSANDHGCADNQKDDENVRDSVESITGSTLGDTITGSCFANTIVGDPGSANGDPGGDDTLSGDPAAGCTAASGSSDFFGGGEGNDTFDGDGTIDGSHFKGFDTVTYGFPYTGHATSASCAIASVNYAVRVTLDDVANDCDGFGNTTDNVSGDIERVIGSPLADNINATAADQAVSLLGRAGADTLTDSPFGDFLNGEGGADTINCTNGGTDSYVIDGADTVHGSCEIGT
jgi:Ca2+-binding RTX toxin-like protein